MTTTAINFTPSTTASPPFTFQFSNDSATYTGSCVWNIAGQRWYLRVYDSVDNLIIYCPLVSSNKDIDLLVGNIPGVQAYYSEVDSLISIVTQD